MIQALRRIRQNIATDFLYCRKHRFSYGKSWFANYSKYNNRMTSELPKDVQSGKIEINGVELYYSKRGQGQPVVLCMPGSFGTGLSDFKHNFYALSESMTVVTFDPRGYGNSRPPDRQFPVDFYRIDADDTIQLMNKLGFDKYCLLGWSDGGITAIIHAATNSKSVSKLILLNACAYFTKADCDLMEPLMDISKWNPKTLDVLSGIYGRETLAQMNKDYYQTFFQIYKNGGDVCKADADKIVCPTLIVHGEKDPMIPSLHAHYLHEHIKHSHLCIVPDGKHAIHKRQPDKINKLVERFFLEDVAPQWDQL
ncbi:uncharacterized protein TRIADDRAFT_23731 [Trichoplax adhaerens]|uniref:AB hydrolase-1 domain-containing protein n=1 Tax=Trichoplax adhaerens TaxID=10228 RepID=B3RTY7_TRIAD|nr:hypothetical protein TRIADDRAFT_23731 [Trichoplax adhaerens]EDV25708.1 hypothetical protein TRIADDRAFT_23731 [Trichoplax adhaerens]|eukprot:XP_002111741.1 hypothetical protein TRIADDRAFT_23731 [Trichoplax adhaerens]